MQAFDLSPLFRSTIGFDRLDRILDSAQRQNDATAYPPYNIIRHGENEYQIVVAVAGFEDKEVDITFQANLLTIAGKKEEEQEAQDYLHRGIAERAFRLKFNLADHIRVTGAEMSHGLLSVTLVREVPEALRPQQIPIKMGKNKEIDAAPVDTKTVTA